MKSLLSFCVIGVGLIWGIESVRAQELSPFQKIVEDSRNQPQKPVAPQADTFAILPPIQPVLDQEAQSRALGPVRLPVPDHEWMLQNAAGTFFSLRNPLNHTTAIPRFESRIEFLRWYLKDGTRFFADSSFHFNEKDQLDRHRRIVAELVEELTNDDFKEARLPGVIDRLHAVLSPREQAAVWFCEVGVNGPWHFLNRQDVIRELDLNQSQLAEIDEQRQLVYRTFETDLRSLKRSAMQNVFAKLSVEQRKKYESISGYRLTALAKYFEDVSRSDFDGVLELHGRHLDARKTFLRVSDPRRNMFTGNILDPLLKHLIDPRQLSNPRIRPHDDEQARRFQNLLDAVDGFANLELYDTNNSADIRDLILKGLVRVGPELDEVQRHALTDGFDRELIGSGFITYVETRDLLGHTIKLNLIPNQVATARDSILVRYGPIKFLITPCVANAVGLSHEEIDELVEFSTDQYVALQTDVRQLMANGFAAVFKPLSADQLRRLENRVGFTLEEMAILYPGTIRDESHPTQPYNYQGLSRQQFLADFDSEEKKSN
jgi:hypothetical protein